MQFRLMIL